MFSKKNIILMIASMAIFVEALDIAIINLTIPSIQAQFKVGNDQVQWLQTLYVLLYGGFLIIGGKLSDVLGKKKIFMIGSVLFLLTSLGAGLSSSFEMLAVFRAVQGLAAALIMPSSLSIVIHNFTEEKERSKAIGIFSSFAAIGSGSGLSFGGIISTLWGWHWVFLINVPILFFVVIIAYFYLETDVTERDKRTPDVISGLLLAATLLMISYAVHTVGDFQEHLGLLSSLVVLIIICLKVLYNRLTRLTAPLINLSIFNSASVVTANLAFILLGGFFTGFLFMVSLILQKDMNLSAAKSGLLLVPFSLLSAIVAKFGIPFLTKRLTISQLGIAGMLSMLIGGVFLTNSVLFNHSLPLVLLSATFVTGLGMTMCYTSLSVLSVQGIPKEHYGLGSSIGTTSYFLGAGIGLSILTLFMKSEDIAVSVNLSSLIVLSLYALIGLVLMFLYNRSKKLQAAASQF
ncbi:MFS transporter [Pedobacter foliorum]|uniref:MFS transporter n=1 Tax=Pedobacter foliorum TaxID=2739058 RepID=UPI001562FCD5|nr:MFS transporter [Pedobacter foliorum]NRF37302.1 MFS transporter [Pedobacter foliorum]